MLRSDFFSTGFNLLIIAFVRNAKIFAIASPVFFSLFPSRRFFWTDWHKLFSIVALSTFDQDLSY